MWSQPRSLPRCPAHLTACRHGTRSAPQRRRCISSLASPRRLLSAASPSRAQALLLLCMRYTLQPTCAAVYSPYHISPPMRHRHCSSWRSSDQAYRTWRTHLAPSQLLHRRALHRGVPQHFAAASNENRLPFREKFEWLFLSPTHPLSMIDKVVPVRVGRFPTRTQRSTSS